TDVASTLQATGSTTCQQQRQRIVVVLVGVAHAAAVQDHRVVQQAAIAIRRFTEFLQEVGNGAAGVEGVELRQLLDVGRHFRVMRKVVEGIVDTTFVEHAVAHLARHHEGGNPGDLRLPGQGQKVEHQARMLHEALRHTYRLVGYVEVVGRRV